MKPEFARIVKWAIVAVIVIVALVIAIPFIQLVLAQPAITMTDTRTFSAIGCGLFGASQVFGFEFTLVNTGNADGFAVVHFLVDGAPALENTYLVPQGESVIKAAQLIVGDCNPHSLGIQIVAVRKA